MSSDDRREAVIKVYDPNATPPNALQTFATCGECLYYRSLTAPGYAKPCMAEGQQATSRPCVKFTLDTRNALSETPDLFARVLALMGAMNKPQLRALAMLAGHQAVNGAQLSGRPVAVRIMGDGKSADDWRRGVVIDRVKTSNGTRWRVAFYEPVPVPAGKPPKEKVCMIVTTQDSLRDWLMHKLSHPPKGKRQHHFDFYRRGAARQQQEAREALLKSLAQNTEPASENPLAEEHAA